MFCVMWKKQCYQHHTPSHYSSSIHLIISFSSLTLTMTWLKFKALQHKKQINLKLNEKHLVLLFFSSSDRCQRLMSVWHTHFFQDLSVLSPKQFLVSRLGDLFSRCFPCICWFGSYLQCLHQETESVRGGLYCWEHLVALSHKLFHSPSHASDIRRRSQRPVYRPSQCHCRHFVSRPSALRVLSW